MKSIIPLLVLSAVSLAACTDGKEIKQDLKEVHTALADQQEHYTFEQKRRKVVRFETTDELYLGFERIDERHGEPLPDHWTTDVRPLNFPKPVSLYEVAAALRRELKIPVHINDKLPSLAFTSGTATVKEKNPKDVVPSFDGQPMNMETRGKFESPLPKDVYFNTTGTWKQILAYTSANFKVGYKYQNGALFFDYYETQDFSLHSVAGVYQNNIGLGGSGGGTKSKSSTKQTTTIDHTIDIWSSVAHGLSARLPLDSRIISRPGTQSITVTAPSFMMPGVRDYFEQQNEILGRQIAWKLEVYSVTISKEDKHRVGMDLVYRDLAGKFGFNFSAAGQALGEGGASLATGTILTPPAGSFLSQFAGTNIYAEAFSKLGDTAIVYSDDKTVPNLLPVKFSLRNEIEYVCERKLASLGDGQQNPVSETKLCVEASGFELNILANIQDDGRVNLQITVSISELIDITPLGDASNFIERPNRNVGDLFHQVFLSSGESVILSGFEQKTKRSREQTGGQALCTLFCQNDQYDSEVKKLFFIVTPTILAPRRALEVASN